VRRRRSFFLCLPASTPPRHISSRKKLTYLFPCTGSWPQTIRTVRVFAVILRWHAFC
jgi:hypothetical protein